MRVVLSLIALALFAAAAPAQCATACPSAAQRSYVAPQFQFQAAPSYSAYAQAALVPVPAGVYAVPGAPQVQLNVQAAPVYPAAVPGYVAPQAAPVVIPPAVGYAPARAAAPVVVNNYPSGAAPARAPRAPRAPAAKPPAQAAPVIVNVDNDPPRRGLFRR